MDAFEQLVAELLFAEGYWAQTSFKVELTKDEKRLIGRHSAPRWELDVVAYRPASNELLVLECKSFLDSIGVQCAEFHDGHASTRYKLFREETLRNTVLARLASQMAATGLCRPDAKVQLGLVAAKIKNGDEDRLRSLFEEHGWAFYGPGWLRDRLRRLSSQGYTNQISAVVAKLLLRQDPSSVAQTGDQSTRTRRHTTISPSSRIELLISHNPKRPGTKSYDCFQGYFSANAKTVEGALGCGVRWEDLRHDLRKGYIRIVP